MASLDLVIVVLLTADRLLVAEGVGVAVAADGVARRGERDLCAHAGDGRAARVRRARLQPRAREQRQRTRARRVLHALRHA